MMEWTEESVTCFEVWKSGQPARPLTTRGLLQVLFYSQYAVGVYKCCSTVFAILDQDDLNYSFDTDFLDPSQLPPGTPRVAGHCGPGFSPAVLLQLGVVRGQAQEFPEFGDLSPNPSLSHFAIL